MFKWLSVVAAALLVGLSPAHAQVSDQERAQAYYFEAEAALADGRLKDANQLRIKAWKILGGGNPKLEFLAARIYYSAGAYDDAQAAVERFYSHEPGPNLRREIAPYVVKIETKIEEARLAEVAAEQKRIAEQKAAEEEARLAVIRAEERRINRPQRLIDTVAACIDERSCRKSLRQLQGEEDQTGVDELRHSVSRKACEMHRVAEACVELALASGLDGQSVIALLDKACSLGDRPSCNTAGYFLKKLNPNTKWILPGLKQDPLRALSFYARSCQLDDYVGCSMAASMTVDDANGVKRDKKSSRSYTLSACEITNRANEQYFNMILKTACEKQGFPKRSSAGWKSDRYDLVDRFVARSSSDL